MNWKVNIITVNSVGTSIANGAHGTKKLLLNTQVNKNFAQWCQSNNIVYNKASFTIDYMVSEYKPGRDAVAFIKLHIGYNSLAAHLKKIQVNTLDSKEYKLFE